MKWRSKVSKQSVPERVQQRKSRFQIMKLEERIAPCAYKYRGRTVHYPGPCGGHKH